MVRPGRGVRVCGRSTRLSSHSSSATTKTVQDLFGVAGCLKNEGTDGSSGQGRQRRPNLYHHRLPHKVSSVSLPPPPLSLHTLPSPISVAHWDTIRYGELSQLSRSALIRSRPQLPLRPKQRPPAKLHTPIFTRLLLVTRSSIYTTNVNRFQDEGEGVGVV